MIELTIDPQIRAIAPSLAVGVVQCDAAVSDSPEALWKDIEHTCSEIKQACFANALAQHGFFQAIEFSALRNLVRCLGKDPARYRGSAEALLRRVMQGKGLYRINCVVEVNNLVSLESKHSVGTYNLGTVDGNVQFRPGRPGERYKGIGKAEFDLEGLPVFADDLGPFGSPFSDSERTMIVPGNLTVSLAIIACSGQAGLEFALSRAASLLSKYAGAKNVITSIRE